MKERAEELRRRIGELNKTLDTLEEKVKAEAVARLCDLIIEEHNQDSEEAPDSPPAGKKKWHSEESPVKLGLQLLRLQAELDLLAEEPDSPWGPVLDCMGQIVHLTMRAGLGYRLSRLELIVAGWFMVGCCTDETRMGTLLECMPLRYSLPVQQMWKDEQEENLEEEEEMLKEILFVFHEILVGCGEWELPREGVQLLQSFAPAFETSLGEEDTCNFYLRILMDASEKQGGTALMAAYGDGMDPAVVAGWGPLQQGDFYWGYGISLLKSERHKEAMAAMEHCYTLRLSTVGPTSVLTLLSRAFYWYVRLAGLGLDDDSQGAAFLVDFLEKAMTHAYDGEIDYDQLMQMLGGMAFGTLGRLARMGKADMLGRLMQLYTDNCIRYDQDPNQIGFRKRYAYGLAGVLETMQYSGNQALEDTLRALETPVPAGEEPLLDNDTLEYNAGYLYMVMGDLPEGLTRLGNLIDRMAEEENTDESIYLRAVSIYCAGRELTNDLDEEEVKELREILQEKEEIICADDQPFPDEVSRLETSVYSSILELLYISGKLMRDELPIYTRVLRTALRRMDKNKLFAGLWLVLLYQLMLFLWLQGDPKALELTEPCARQVREAPVLDRLKASCLLVITLIQNQYRGPLAAAPYARNQLQELESQWKNSVRMLDDFSLTISMTNAYTVFGNAYCILKQQIGPEQSFELVLRFKALASLAARERNRILLTLRDGEAKADLEELRRLQNRRTVLCTLPDEDEAQMAQIGREMARLSARIEAAMPGLGQFTPLSLQALSEKLPEDSAVVEYYWAIRSTVRLILQGEDPQSDPGLDVYVLRRCNGQVQLECRTLKEHGMQELQDACEAFRSCCGDGDNYADRDTRARKNDLRRQLYQALIQPVEDLLAGVRTLYIAPEEVLRDIPYGLLGTDGSHTLEQRYTVVQMICSRDLLFDNDAADQGGACVVGDPDYQVNNREVNREQNQGTERSTDGKLVPLPFSRTEAELVSGCVAGTCLTGRNATKQAVMQQAGQYGILHIAAHGDFQDLESDSLFRARLYLAGAQDFLDTAREDPRCGNGILTANEISRMDLHGTWLTVLSACFSGLGESTLSGSIQGMVAAFAAAGSRYVVASLWEADDFATAELMRRFYRELCGGCSVPDALRRAKHSLAQATVADLRQAGWELLRHRPDIPEEMRDMLDLRLERADGFRPFADEYYWGGFVCHRCR